MLPATVPQAILTTVTCSALLLASIPLNDDAQAPNRRAGLPAQNLERCAAVETPGARPATPQFVPTGFIENRGQWSAETTFARLSGSSRVLLHSDGFTVQRLRVESWTEPREGGLQWRLPSVVSGWNVALTFEGASNGAELRGEDNQPGHVNFLIGRDPSGWATHVPRWARVIGEDLYPGVRVVFHERSGAFEYDLELEPWADLDQVRISCEGIDGLSLEEDGSLMLATPFGPLRQPPPVVLGGEGLQAGAAGVGVSYRVVDTRTFGFEVMGWNRTGPLTIDPVVVFATMLGGSGNEFLFAAATIDGRSLVGGYAFSTFDYPTTPGAFQVSGAVPGDGVITSLAADGQSLEFSTFLGGSSLDDLVAGVSWAGDGTAIVVGSTDSAYDFPVTDGAFDETGNGVADGFVARLSADGSSLLYSTYLGGSDTDFCSAVAVDADGHAYVTGAAESADFPTTGNAFAASLTSPMSAFVTRIAPDGATLDFSTYVGGYTNGKAIAVDVLGSAYVTGWEGGHVVFPPPLTPGAFDTTWNGEADVWVVKFDPTGSSVIYGTYLGGSFWEEGVSIDVDGEGNACVTGRTDSSDFPTTPLAFDKTLSGGSGRDGFVTKLNSTGSALLYSTFLGGSGNEDIGGVRFGTDNSIFVAGDTGSVNFPITPNGWQTVKSGGGDAFLVQFDSTLSSVKYGTYIGGSNSLIETGAALAVDENNSAFVVGWTNSSNFPTTPGAFDNTFQGFNDGFVVRIDFSPWIVLGSALAGTNGAPQLHGTGTLQAGSPGELDLTGALPLASAALVTGLSAINAPFKGGTLVPAPFLVVPIVTDSSGGFVLPWSAWPAGIPSETTFDLQAWIHDPGGPKGWAASNDLRAVTP